MASEGRTRLAVVADADARGPAARDATRPFFNPAMRVNRDLSIVLVEELAKSRGRQVDVGDALAGAGARSLRLAHEVDADIVVHANDGDPQAIEAIRRAARANGIPARRLEASRGGAHAFLAARRFDVVDVDPYGSPAPFLDAAVRATRHKGLVCVTATDTASLCGRYPRVCRRRYGAWHGLHRHAWRAEVGLRILAGAVVQAAARHERGATPVVSVARGHWMRVVCRIEEGRKGADAAAARLAYAVPDDRGAAAFTRAPPEGQHWAGPLWSGGLHDGPMLGRLEAADRVHEDTAALLQACLEEADAPAFWLDAGDLRSRIGVDAPRQEALRSRLRALGARATCTHIDAQGTRTDADWDTVVSAWCDGKDV